MTEISVKPVAWVRNSRTSQEDDGWGEVVSDIELAKDIPTASLDGIADFSHLEILYFFDRADRRAIKISGRPRGKPEFPIVGIFAQRKKERPNRIGLCTVTLVARRGRRITVKHLDAIDGTPVLDIKPVMREFQPKGRIRQPKWTRELMKNYWVNRTR